MSATVSEASLVREAAPAATRSGVPVFLRVSLLGVLLAAPLAFGATTTVAAVLLIAAAWALVLVWLFAGMARGALSLSGHPVALPVALLLGFTAVHWAAGISVAAHATQLEWLRWVGYAALALVAVQTFNAPRRLTRLAEALALAGCGIALLAIAQYLTSNGKIYWLVEPTYGGWIFGPYVNRNHYAGLMELWTPLAIGLALRPGNSPAKRWLWCAMALVMGASVVLSGSRGGTLALAVELVIFTLAAAALHSGRRAFGALALTLVLLGGAAWAVKPTGILHSYTEAVRPSVTAQEEASVHRIGAWQGSWTLFRQHWTVGSGLDTFAYLFPAVRPFATDKIWTHAHNDWLQFLAETGAVGAALGLWILAVGGVVAWRNLRRTAGSATGDILLGLAAGCLGLLIHGWLDFNFHVPANAANFAVLAAVLTRRGWDES